MAVGMGRFTGSGSGSEEDSEDFLDCLFVTGIAIRDEADSSGVFLLSFSATPAFSAAFTFCAFFLRRSRRLSFCRVSRLRRPAKRPSVFHDLWGGSSTPLIQCPRLLPPVFGHSALNPQSLQCRSLRLRDHHAF